MSNVFSTYMPFVVLSSQIDLNECVNMRCGLTDAYRPYAILMNVRAVYNKLVRRTYSNYPKSHTGPKKSR